MYTRTLPPIRKRDLAAAYGPGLSSKSARRRLERWIHGNPRLMRALSRVNYDKNKKFFTPNELKIIYFYLGPP